MYDFGFSPNETTLSNISVLSQLESKISEQRICELHEIATDMKNVSLELLKNELGLYEVLSLISDGLSLGDCIIHENAMEENISAIRAYLSASSLSDRAVLCRLWIGEMREAGVSISEAMFLQSDERNESIAYVKNSFSDEAFDVFSVDFKSPKVAYAKDFREALKMVADSEVGFCLLPLEERGLRLPTIADLIFNGDFKINAVTPVFGFDGSADMKYALVSKGFSVPEKRADDDRYLEIRIGTEQRTALTEALFAAEFYGIGVYSVNTLDLGAADTDKKYYSVIFRDDGNSFVGLLTYLTLFSPSFTPVGIYKNLE